MSTANYNNLFNGVSRKTSAWVVFSGQADCRWLRILKPGFRHCMVLLHDGKRWLSVDPMLNHMELQVHETVPEDFDFPRWLQTQGQLVVRASVDHSKKIPAPLMFMSCVEVVKRVLGIHSRRIITPWQLYRYLKEQSKTNRRAKWVA